MINTLKFVKTFGRCGTENRIKNRLLHNGMRGAFVVDSTNHTYQHNLNRRLNELIAKKSLFSLRIVPMVRNFSSACDESNGNELVVYHDPNARIFYVDVDGGGFIEYERKDDLMILKHTFVSNELGGRGIGKILAKEALEYVAKNDLQLEIECSFVRKYVSNYEPKYIKFMRK